MILPILRPAIAASMVYAFVRAITSVSAVIFLVSGEYNLATVYIVGRAEYGEYGLAIVYSAVLIVIMLLALIGIQAAVGERRIGRRAVAQPQSRGPVAAHETRRIAQQPAVTFETVTKRYGARHRRRRDRLHDRAGHAGHPARPFGLRQDHDPAHDRRAWKRPAGRILIGGADVTGLPASERDVSMVFQSYALFPHMTVMENVCYGLRARGLPSAAPKSWRPRSSALVGLSGFERRLPSELSGGQQQRVAVARAIVLEPKVLLFDEPLSNLDAKLRRRVREDIREPAAADWR